MPELPVFLSWSKSGSHAAAQAFNEWLPEVVPGVKPWLSSEDIPKGAPWFSSLSAALSQGVVCLICVTQENVTSPWLFYEAGAIAHANQGSLICPYLIGVEASAIAGGPSGQYQATRFDKEDTWRLVRDINKRLSSAHHEGLLRRNFDANWTSLQKKLARVAEAGTSSQPPDKPDEADLSDEAKHILVEASQDKDGAILMLRDTGGFVLQTGDRCLCAPNDARIEANFRDAVNDLVRRGLLDRQGSKGEIFRLTKRGWSLADDLRKQQAVPAQTPVVTDDADAMCLLQSWWSGRPTSENLKAIAFEDVDREVKLVPGTATRLLETAVRRFNYVVENRGPTFVVFRKLSFSEQKAARSDPGWNDPRNPYRRR